MHALPLFIALAFFSSFAHAAGPDWAIADHPRHWLLNEGSYSIGADFSNSYSQDFFDNNGAQDTIESISLGNLSHYNTLTGKLHAGFGVAPSLSFFAQLAGVYASLVRTDQGQANGLESKLDRVGGGDGFLAFRYSIWNSPRFLSLLELSWVFPTYGDPDLNEIELGDKSNDVTIMYRGAYHFSNQFTGSAGVGYTRRTNGYSDEIPYFVRFDFLIPSAKKLRFFGEWRANFSLKNDTLSDVDIAAGLNSANSISFNSINPENGKLGAGGALQVGKRWDLAAAFYRSLLGKNSLVENIFSLALTYTFSHAKTASVGPPEEVIAEFEEQPEPNLDSLEEPQYNYRRPRLQKNVKYGFSTRVSLVSPNNNFLAINAGSEDGVQVGDVFHIFSSSEQAVGQAITVAVRAKEAFLRVEVRPEGNHHIPPDSEARQVIPDLE